MDCEFLNNRQAFLNLCQGNRYQFDPLRRAKHSSMMVLWHLHNRDAPKFVQQCTTCSREILQGYRFHCAICADFDQCQDCIQNPNIPRHPHQLNAIPVSGQQTALTEAQRKERQRSIQLHMTLLQHAATCNSPNSPKTLPKSSPDHSQTTLQNGAEIQFSTFQNGTTIQLHTPQNGAKSSSVPSKMEPRTSSVPSNEYKPQKMTPKTGPRGSKRLQTPLKTLPKPSPNPPKIDYKTQAKKTVFFEACFSRVSSILAAKTT